MIKDGCGKEECMSSSHAYTEFEGPLGGMTFGSGYLSNDGFWENPCHACARAFEAQWPEATPCWPYEGQTFGPEYQAIISEEKARWAQWDKLDEDWSYAQD
jgi:hypothetical protein